MYPFIPVFVDFDMKPPSYPTFSFIDSVKRFDSYMSKNYSMSEDFKQYPFLYIDI